MTDFPTPNRYTGRTAPIRLVVMHTTESSPNTARSIAQYFQNPTVKASAHYIVGTDGTYSSVSEYDTAWAAPGANAQGIQIEQCAYAYKTDWTSNDGKAVVSSAARLVADVCKRNNIPIKHLTDSEIAAGQSGICGHDQISRVYKKSDHTDPGPAYPWDSLINQANGKETTDMTNDQAAKLDNVNYAISKIILPVLARLDQARATQTAETAALKAAVSTLATTQGLDPDTIKTTVDKAVKEALASLEITLATTKEETK